MRALLSGFGVGVGLGLLLAPDAGGVTRRKLGDRIANWFKHANSDSLHRHEEHGSRRDPEERSADQREKDRIREKMLDKTLADSFPTSDPPSSIPDPSGDSLS